MIRKYHYHKPQTTPWHREEEPLNHHETPGRQIKQSNQLTLPHQDDCNTGHNVTYKKLEQLQTPTMGVTINKLYHKQLLNSSKIFNLAVLYMYLIKFSTIKSVLDKSRVT